MNHNSTVGGFQLKGIHCWEIPKIQRTMLEKSRKCYINTNTKTTENLAILHSTCAILKEKKPSRKDSEYSVTYHINNKHFRVK